MGATLVLLLLIPILFVSSPIPGAVAAQNHPSPSLPPARGDLLPRAAEPQADRPAAPAAGPDSLRLGPDSLRLRPDSRRPEPDSPAAPPVGQSASGDSSAVDSLAASSRPRRLYSWRESRLDPVHACGPGSGVVPRAEVDRSSDGTAREFLEWRAGLQRIPGASHHGPDPLDAGDLPGREPIGSVVEGFPRSTWALPEPMPEIVTPVWLQSASLHPADPLLDPSNPSGGPLFEFELLRPDSARATSVARLTSGFNRTYSEEFFLARSMGAGLLRIGYGDAKTDGRFGTGYFRQFSENLLGRYDRGVSWGGWRFGWQHSRERIRPDPSSRLLHDCSGMEGGALVRLGSWSADLGGGLSWMRLAYEGDPAAKRKDALVRGLLRVVGPGERLRPLATVEWNRDHLRFYRPGASYHAADVTATGPAVAAGVEGATSLGRYRGSLGFTQVTRDRSGWTAAGTWEAPLRFGWEWSAHADRVPRVPVVPRLAGDLSTYVGQGLYVAGSFVGAPQPIVDGESRLEEITRAEVELRRANPTTRRPWIAIRGRWVEIRHALVPTLEELAYLRSDLYGFLPRRVRDRTVRVAALHLSGEPPLPAGWRLQLQYAARSARPGWQSQLWMTPWNGRARLSHRRSLFRRDLVAEGYVRCEWSAERAVPTGRLPASGRVDAGVSGQVDALTLFLDLWNLTSATVATADLDLSAESWTPAPLRSYRMGLTWRFLD